MVGTGQLFPWLMGFNKWFLDRMWIKCILDTQTIPFTRKVNGGNWSFIPENDGYWQFVPRPDVNPKMSEEMEHIYNSEASSIKKFNVYPWDYWWVAYINALLWLSICVRGHVWLCKLITCTCDPSQFNPVKIFLSAARTWWEQVNYSLTGCESMFRFRFQPSTIFCCISINMDYMLTADIFGLEMIY